MIDIKCTYNGKTYRGQDFWSLYCRQCPHRSELTFHGGLLSCPYLKYYESYRPKRRRGGLGMGESGQPASIPTPQHPVSIPSPRIIRGTNEKIGGSNNDNLQGHQDK